MTDTKQIIDDFKEGIKNKKLQHVKSSKIRVNTKKKDDKMSGLMLSRIEEFIEIGKKGMSLQDRLLDTCILKNINKLFLNKNGENDKDNNMIGYTIDNKNKTIIKFNKTPNQLHIEQFTFPDKNEKNKKNRKLTHNDSYLDYNNISEHKDNINFLKKFKEDYNLSDPEKKNHKKVKSTIISAKKLKKEFRMQKSKNTVFLKDYNMDKILKMNSKERKRKNNDKEKDKNQKEKIKTRRDESKKRDRDRDKDTKSRNDDSTSILRKKGKSKTRKQSKIVFHFNKGKSLSKKISDNYNNIQKIDVDKKNGNESIVNADEIKSNKKQNKNNKIILRTSLKSVEKTPKSSKSKKSKKKKVIKFQSVLFPKKKSLFEPKSKKQKHDSGESDKKQDDKMNFSDSDNLYSDKSSNKNSNSEKDIYDKKREKEREKEKNKKKKIQNNIKTYKEDTSTSNDDNDNNNKENEYNESSKIKDILKIKNTSYNYSHYKIRHTNNICLGTSLNRQINNFFVKTPKFRVVEPENLISLEYDRAYERNKNNNNFTCNNFDDNLNETNMKEEINERNVAKIKKKNKSFFCCL